MSEKFALVFHHPVNRSGSPHREDRSGKLMGLDKAGDKSQAKTNCSPLDAEAEIDGRPLSPLVSSRVPSLTSTSVLPSLCKHSDLPSSLFGQQTLFFSLSSSISPRKTFSTFLVLK